MHPGWLQMPEPDQATLCLQLKPQPVDRAAAGPVSFGSAAAGHLQDVILLILMPAVPPAAAVEHCHQAEPRFCCCFALQLQTADPHAGTHSKLQQLWALHPGQDHQHAVLLLQLVKCPACVTLEHQCLADVLGAAVEARH